MLWAPEIIDEDLSAVSRRGEDLSTALFKPHPLPDDLARYVTANISREELESSWPPFSSHWVVETKSSLWTSAHARLSRNLSPKERLSVGSEQSLAVSIVSHDGCAWIFGEPKIIEQPAHMGMSGALGMQFMIFDYFSDCDVVFNAADNTHIQVVAASHKASYFSSLLDGFDIIYTRRSKSFQEFAKKLVRAALLRGEKILAAERARLLLQLNVDEPQIPVLDMPIEPGAPHRSLSGSKEVSLTEFN